MDEKGFQQVLKGGDRAAMEAFIRHNDGKGEELHLFVLKKGQGIPVRKSEIVWKTIAKTIFETTVAGFRGKVNKVDGGKSELQQPIPSSLFFLFAFGALSLRKGDCLLCLVPKSEMISSWRSTRSLC